ncbi:hypothetical protein OAH57_01570 [Nitrosopumilus sp.]|nr:hypothetical protein [Nitrosopumilus sp.]MDB4857225.1 hypothetical protein [Nitrosopumilus sp.]
MTEWNTLRARFPDDEFNEIERIKEQYGLSYNEIIRSGVKFYVGLTLAKELLGDSFKEKDITIGGKNLGEIINSSEVQQNIEQKITKIAKILLVELFDKGMDLKEKTKSIRKERKVGRPKSKKKVGRPKQGLD